VAGRTVLVTVDDGGALARVDAKTRKAAGPAVPGEYQPGGDLVSGEGSVWAAMSTGEIGKVDPESGSVLNTVPIPDPGSDGRLAVGGGAVWVIASQRDRRFIIPVDTRSYEAEPPIDLGRGSIAARLTFAEGAL
jgi:streptogramin lyase